MLFATTPTNPINGRELLPKEQGEDYASASTSIRSGHRQIPASSKPREVYDAILTGKPYPIKALVLFGSDPLLGHGDPLRGKAALEALDFYVHVDTTINPSAHFADLILPATTCWEREALMPFFEIAEDTMNWAQLRPAVAKAVGESRSESEIIFDLGQALGSDRTVLRRRYRSRPRPINWRRLDFTTEQLRANPIGMRAKSSTRHRKYAEIDTAQAQAKGFRHTDSARLKSTRQPSPTPAIRPLPDFESNRTRKRQRIRSR